MKLFATFSFACFVFVITLLFVAPAQLFAQKTQAMSPFSPVPMMEPEAPAPHTVVPDYTIRPSLPIRPDSAPQGKGHTAIASIEAADSVFIIGEKLSSEAIRVAKVGPHGWALVLEDVSRPVIYLRLQHLVTQSIDVRLYTESGLLMFEKTLRNLPLNNQVEMGYREWPKGLYTLHVQLDDGRKWTKKIRMSEQVSNY